MTLLRSIFAPADGAGQAPTPAPYLIAEAGVNHDGSVADAHALIDLAADSGADAVKFQTFEPAALVSATAAAAAYQTASTGARTQAEMLAKYVLPLDAWPELSAHAEDRGIEFLSTAFDFASLDLVCDLGVQGLKLGSGELTNRTLLEEVGRRGLPVLCSTGMGTLDEVGAALGWLGSAPSPSPVALLHCVSSYPAPVDQCNLRALATMRQEFGVPTGWSDHTVGVVSVISAVALGAVVLEKHVTLDNQRSGPDHAASADPDAFVAYVRAVRDAHAALGDGVKKPVPAEAENIPVVRRSWHAARDLPPGETLHEQDLLALRPESGVPAWADIVGRTLVEGVAAGQPVTESDLRSPSGSAPGVAG